MVTKPKTWVGVDLGSRAIKVVELERGPSGWRLVKHLIQELPVPSDGQPVDRAGWLQSALKEFDARELQVSISGPEVAIRRVRVPPMSKRELPEAARWQVKDQVSFPVQDAVLDVEVVGEVWDKDLKKQDLLVGMASKAAVQELLAVVERAGVRVMSVSPSPYALWRCASTLAPEARQGSVAVVEMGDSKTQVSIGKDGAIRLVRDLPIGGAVVTEALVGVVASEGGEVTIDRAKAQLLTRRYGVLAQPPEGATEEGVPLFHLSSLMRPVLERLLTELSRVLDFYRVQIDDAGVSRVLLCGGGANLKQLQAFLAEGLGLPVEMLNPLIHIAHDAQPLEPAQLAEFGPRLAVALGAAIDHGQGVNLLRREGHAALPLPVLSRETGLRAAKALAGAALVLYLGLQLVAGVLQWQVRARERLWAQAEPAYTQYLGITASRSTLESVMDRLQRFLDHEPVWDGIFKELSRLMPPALQLEALEVELGSDGSAAAPSIHLKGRAGSGTTTGDGSIAKLIEAMGLSIFFSNVKLVSSELHSSATSRASFDIEATLK